ncbi:inositol-tetrakisphosphate 1-kinase 1-like [Bidens hawaiensis]|uniref:inositol-tetrakisphosphate 1-kinase 1-like n=1 Tax=Bidens hawaiensis TaxID=980011 RepID=UPI004049A6CE
MVEPFITYAQQRGIDFIPIDVTKPLTEQGPFDCIIHKSYGQEWDQSLETFSINHPNATIIDRPSAIQRLHNRISMLEPISQLNVPKLGIPNQVLVQDFECLKSVQTDKELVFPVIAKPLLADGATGAHKMSLVVNHEGLAKLNPPVVLQQFVNHGGVIFKVYVAGDYVKCVKRSSLPDISNETMVKITLESDGLMCFSQISSSVKSDEKPKMPSQEFLVDVANGLRQALGLHLFNFDMIKDDKTDDYLVVDINYFPGFEKLPFYESVMTDFLLNIKKSQEEKKMMMKEDVDVHEETQA